jgi:hypothetical protein
MMPDFNFKRAFVTLIEQTGDPTAPIKLQELHKYAEAVGQMLVPVGSLAAVEEHTKKLLSQYPEGNTLDQTAASPDFMIALCSLVTQATILLGRKAGEYYPKRNPQDGL